VPSKIPTLIFSQIASRSLSDQDLWARDLIQNFVKVSAVVIVVHIELCRVP
jgi:hypothetical protein